MAIVNITFNKISAERRAGVLGKINISNNVSVKDVSEADFNIGSTKQKGLKYSYEFSSKFEPKVGSIIIEGDVLVLEETKKVNEILKGWKKNKKIDKEILAPVINMILSKCNIKALILSQDVNLPSPIPLPRVKKE